MSANVLTMGHRRLLAAMGFPLFQTARAGEAGDETVPVEQRTAAVMAAMWLATRALEEVRPGGLVATAIKTGTWQRLFDEWEFSVTQAVMDEFPPEFLRCCEMGAPILPNVPDVEPPAVEE
jgi:hypothetical protein